MAQSGLFVIGGASAVSIGFDAALRGFRHTWFPGKSRVSCLSDGDGAAQNDGDYSDPGPIGDQARNGGLSGKHEQL